MNKSIQLKESSVVLVFNSSNELALQLRAKKDASYPSRWDFSAAGGINQGESHFMAAQRELKEEIGISSILEYIGKKTYIDEKVQDNLYIYKTLYNGNFKINLIEVQEIRFFRLEEIESLISNSNIFHPEFIYIWESGLIKELMYKKDVEE